MPVQFITGIQYSFSLAGVYWFGEVQRFVEGHSSVVKNIQNCRQITLNSRSFGLTLNIEQHFENVIDAVYGSLFVFAKRVYGSDFIELVPVVRVNQQDFFEVLF